MERDEPALVPHARMRRGDGVSFVGKRIDAIHAREGMPELRDGVRKRVENVAHVHEEDGEKNREDRGLGTDKGDGEQLGRAGIDKERQRGSEPPRLTVLNDEKSEGHAQRNHSQAGTRGHLCSKTHI